MKAYVITMLDHELSVQSSKKCIESAKAFGIQVEMQEAITPQDDPIKIMAEEGVDNSKFINNIYSKAEPAMCCFLSHRSIWKKVKENTLILEHDSIIISPMPDTLIRKIVNVGQPSYGSFLFPNEKQLISPSSPSKYINGAKQGLYKLFSKVGGYLPGTHGYIVSPNGAKELLDHSYESAEPADIYMNNKRFPDIQEYFPWSVKADDSFSFIQKRKGCLAKHNYNEKFKIL